MTINVTSVNDAPGGHRQHGHRSTRTGHTFSAADFGFTDPNDTRPTRWPAVKITTLPAAGTLTTDGVASRR